jgi:pentatricopeptide repeat protein
MSRRSKVHYNFGLLLAQMGEDGPAETALLKTLDLEPDSMDYLFALMDLYYRRGRLEAALQLVERMIAAHLENPLGHDLKVRIEARL